MFGSEIVSKAIYDQLVTLPGVIAGFAGKIVPLPVLPQAVPLPGIAFYPEFSAYSGPMGRTQLDNQINYEQLRFVTKAMCAKTSTAPIAAIAKEMLEYFSGLVLNVVDGGTNYQIIFEANGELLPTTVVDGANFYRQLGTVYDIQLTRGG